MSGYQIRMHLFKDKLERIANEKSIGCTDKLNIKKEGWMGKSKGLLQTLWDRSFVDKKTAHVFI